MWIPEVAGSKVQKAQAERRDPSLPFLCLPSFGEQRQLVQNPPGGSISAEENRGAVSHCHPNNFSAEYVCTSATTILSICVSSGYATRSPEPPVLRLAGSAWYFPRTKRGGQFLPSCFYILAHKQAGGSLFSAN